MVNLEEYPFQGKEREIRFPIRISDKILLIQYTYEKQTISRLEEHVTITLKNEKERERLVLEDVTGLEFKFSYEGDKEKTEFENFWLDDPYRGLPRGVLINLNYNHHGRAESISRMVSIPQGRMGVLTL